MRTSLQSRIFVLDDLIIFPHKVFVFNYTNKNCVCLGKQSYCQIILSNVDVYKLEIINSVIASEEFEHQQLYKNFLHIQEYYTIFSWITIRPSVSNCRNHYIKNKSLYPLNIYEQYENKLLKIPRSSSTQIF